MVVHGEATGRVGWIFSKHGHLTRIDCALDDRQGSVHLDVIQQAVTAGQHVTQAKTIKLLSQCGKTTRSFKGQTIYIGSEANETRLRIYDKRLELEQKGRPEWLKYGIRWELQLRKKRARALRRKLAAGHHAGWWRIIIGVLRAFIDFRDVKQEVPKWARSRAKPVSWWVQLTESFERAQLAGQPSPAWGLSNIRQLLNQMAPSPSVLVDLPVGRAILEAEISADRGRRKLKHLRLLRQYGIASHDLGVIQQRTLSLWEKQDRGEALLTGQPPCTKSEMDNFPTHGGITD